MLEYPTYLEKGKHSLLSRNVLSNDIYPHISTCIYLLKFLSRNILLLGSFFPRPALFFQLGRRPDLRALNLCDYDRLLHSLYPEPDNIVESKAMSFKWRNETFEKNIRMHWAQVIIFKSLELCNVFMSTGSVHWCKRLRVRETSPEDVNNNNNIIDYN